MKLTPDEWGKLTSGETDAEWAVLVDSIRAALAAGSKVTPPDAFPEPDDLYHWELT